MPAVFARRPAPRHRRNRPRRRRRRTALLATASLAVTTAVGAVLVAAPAGAAGPWYVAPGGSNAASCLSAATPCATLSGVLAKPGLAAGDTVNVAPGTYTDKPGVTRAVKVVGSGPGVVFQGGGSTAATWALAVNTTGTVELRNLTLTGGTYAAGGTLPIVGATVKAYDVAITDGTAALGGGVYVHSGSLEMYGGRIAGNKATAVAANPSTGWGGGAYVPAGASLLLDGVTVASNTADGAGVAPYALGGGIASAGTLTLRDTTLRDNRAVSSGATANTGFGGALYVNGPSTTITGGSLRANTASYGGAVVNAKPVTLSGAEVRGNTALVGGGLYATAPSTVTDSTIAANKATATYGGGVYAGATLTLDGTEVSGNSAVAGGGGVYTGAVAATLRRGTTVSGNLAQTGGGVWTSGTLTVRDSTISGNNASFQGGGLVVGSSATADRPVAQVVDSAVTGNTAPVGGGAVTLARGALVLTGARLADNSASAGGGLVVSPDSSATLDRVVATGNVATSLGGGAVYNSGRTTILDTRLTNNEAVRTTGTTTGLGGAVYTGGGTAPVNAELIVRRSTLDGNRAFGGAALASYAPASGSTSKTVLENATVSGNVATSTSGAILNGDHPLTVVGSTIADNAAANGGAGGIVAATPGLVGVAGTVLTGNTPKSCNTPLAAGAQNVQSPAGAGCGYATGAVQVGALQDNGGPTPTRLPGAGSVLLDSIPPGTSTGLTDAVGGDPVVLCTGGATDQRGTTRPQGARCDVGAVEAAQVAPVIEVPASIDVTVGSRVDQALVRTTTGSPWPALTATGLPAGLSLTDNGDGTANLTGTPSGPGGSFTVTVRAANEAGTTQADVTVEVHQPPVLTGPTSLTYRVGTAGGPDLFRQSGGHPAATLSIVEQLPQGLAFTPGADGTGTLAGTPAAGTGGVHRLTVKGANGTTPDATWPFTLTIEEAASVQVADATVRVGTDANLPVTATGYPRPALSASGLPAGLAVSGGAITGTPAPGTGGSYRVTVSASNGVGADASTTFTLVVQEAASIDGPVAVRLVVGEEASFSYAAAGFPAPTLTVEGALPAGVSFTDRGAGAGVLSGTPTAAGVGVRTVTITASNGIGGVSRLDVRVEVVSSVTIATTTLPQAAVGSAYDSFVVGQGGVPPYTFRVVGGSLPAGLSLAADGRVSGTPTGEPGTASVTVEVADSGRAGTTDRRTLSLTVTRGVTALAVAPLVTTGTLIQIGTLSARLTGGLPAQPLAGQTITFKGLANLVVCTAVTNADGVATCRLTLVSTLLAALRLGYTAEYAGSTRWLPAQGTGGLL